MKKLKKQIDYRQLNANKKFCNQDIEEKVAEQLNVSPLLVRAIANAQTKLAAKTIRSGTLETVILPYIGKLKVNLRQVQKMMKQGLRK